MDRCPHCGKSLYHEDIDPAELARVRKIIAEGEARLKERLDQLARELPSWDPSLDRIRITI